MNKTFYSFSFGCRVNEAEKEEFDRQMLKAGFKYSVSNPSIYIINTCSVTHKAEREAKQHIYQVRRKFPASKIVVTGCSATYWKKNDLALNLPVDETFDNLQKDYLVQLLLKRQQQENRQSIKNPTSKFLDSGRLLLKIQDGCQRFCSFCVVPYLRGKPKSYSTKNLVSGIQKKEKHIKEVILTAINTEAFGYDTGETFINLIQKIINETRVQRISFGSIHPWSINRDFLKFYEKILPTKRLVNFFHIPIQSGSDKMLRLMKRGYTRDEMMDKLIAIKRINDFAFIGTDVIVGFLDETEKDFEETYSFLDKAPINKFHIFRFSKRQNTAAYYLSKRLYEAPNHVKQARAKKLTELGAKKYQQFLQRHINTTFDGMFLKYKTDSYQKVLLSNQVPVYIKTSKLHCSEIKKIKITEYKNGELFGKIV
jgi:threonylcarbamoyladenosine tRNA methylthiotransferase MtaB